VQKPGARSGRTGLRDRLLAGLREAAPAPRRMQASGYGRPADARKKAYDCGASEAGLISITGSEEGAGEGRHLGRRHRRRHVGQKIPRRSSRSSASRATRESRHGRRARE